MYIRFSHAKYLIIALLLIVLFLVGLIRVGTHKKMKVHLANSKTSIAEVNLSAQIINSLTMARLSFDDIMHGHLEQISVFDKNIEESLRIGNKLLNLIQDLSMRRQVEHYILNLTRFHRICHLYHEEMVSDPSSDTSAQLSVEALKIKQQTVNEVLGFIQIINQKAIQGMVDVEAIMKSNQKQHTWIFFISLAIGCLCIYTISVAISRPLNRLIRVIRKLGAGETDIQIELPDKDIIGQLGHEFNQMALKLNDAISLQHGIMHSLPFMMVCVSQDGRVIMNNKIMSDQLGVTTNEMTGKTLWQMLPGIAKEKERFIEMFDRNDQIFLDKYPLHINNDIFLCDITIYPIMQSQKRLSVILIQDMTASVKMQEALRQAEKMKSVGGLAAGMAHEINNPLAGIVQNTQLLESRLLSSLGANERAAGEIGTTLDVIRQYSESRKLPSIIDRILEAGANASKIVDSLLFFAGNNQSGDIDIEIEPLIDKTIELLKHDYGLKKYDFRSIRIKKSIPPNIPPVRCNESKMIQALYNICKNAAAAMHEWDDPKKQDPQIDFMISAEKTFVQLEIRDNGPGMDKKIKERIFEPFFTTKDVDKGKGLGLSIAYYIIVEDLKGRLMVESSPGSGAAFIIRIPSQG